MVCAKFLLFKGSHGAWGKRSISNAVVFSPLGIIFFLQTYGQQITSLHALQVSHFDFGFKNNYYEILAEESITPFSANLNISFP